VFLARTIEELLSTGSRLPAGRTAAVDEEKATDQIKQRIQACRRRDEQAGLVSRPPNSLDSYGELEFKLSSVPSLERLWGSCSLGRAVNAAIGRDALHDFAPGLLSGPDADVNMGQSLILTVRPFLFDRRVDCCS